GAANPGVVGRGRQRAAYPRRHHACHHRANAATRAVNAFKVGNDGKLTKIDSSPLPGNFPNVAGLAAN
ncbi:MAG: hypothetical protein ABI556_10440, partial [Gemmatimonadales bacterium]